MNSLDKKLKDGNSRIIASNGMKATSKNNKSIPTSAGSREVASLKEKIKLLEVNFYLHFLFLNVFQLQYELLSVSSFTYFQTLQYA